LRGFEWRLLWQRCRGDDLYALRRYSNSLHALSSLRMADTLATRSGDNHLKVWDLTTSDRRFTITNVTTLGGFSLMAQVSPYGMGTARSNSAKPPLGGPFTRSKKRGTLSRCWLTEKPLRRPRRSSW
jgi:hypothetical protein